MADEKRRLWRSRKELFAGASGRRQSQRPRPGQNKSRNDAKLGRNSWCPGTESVFDGSTKNVMRARLRMGVERREGQRTGRSDGACCGQACERFGCKQGECLRQSKYEAI